MYEKYWTTSTKIEIMKRLNVNTAPIYARSQTEFFDNSWLKILANFGKPIYYFLSLFDFPLYV